MVSAGSEKIAYCLETINILFIFYYSFRPLYVVQAKFLAVNEQLQSPVPGQGEMVFKAQTHL
jgi:hypothetical protein